MQFSSPQKIPTSLIVFTCIFVTHRKRERKLRQVREGANCKPWIPLGQVGPPPSANVGCVQEIGNLGVHPPTGGDLWIPTKTHVCQRAFLGGTRGHVGDFTFSRLRLPYWNFPQQQCICISLV